MIDIDYYDLKNRLIEAGLTTETVDTVLNELKQGINLEVEPKSFKFKAGSHCEITALDPKGQIAGPENEGPLTVYRFSTNIEGIDDYKIKSISIPKLDCAVVSALVIGVEIYPFNVRKLIQGTGKLGGEDGKEENEQKTR